MNRQNKLKVQKKEWVIPFLFSYAPERTRTATTGVGGQRSIH